MLIIQHNSNELKKFHKIKAEVGQFWKLISLKLPTRPFGEKAFSLYFPRITESFQVNSRRSRLQRGSIRSYITI